MEEKREVERKYEADGSDVRLPDLTGVRGVAAVHDEGVTELDAVYYDTPDLRLAAASLTLRRRTGGADAGWHLKFPVATGIRDEIRAPLSESLPPSLAGLLRSRVRDEPVAPVVRLRTSRAVRHLAAADGTPLAELATDTVHAQRLPTGPATTWTEIEVELADDTAGADEALLDAVEKRLKTAGIRRSSSPSKLARALEETGTDVPEAGEGTEGDGTAGAAVLAYVRTQADALVALDPAVRRELPDAVHQMRVAARRLRSAFKTYRKVLDRTVTDPVGEELKWLAGELGHARDQEVLQARLSAALDALPPALVVGPARRRLRTWDSTRSGEAKSRGLVALDSARHLALLDRLDALLAAPPLRPTARKKAKKALPEAVLRDYRRLADRVDLALALDPGTERDLALHEARKAAKRARYAGEAATPTLGKPAKRFAKRMKRVQSCLGDHQDSVVARAALLDLATEAHEAGESAFTWGVLVGREQAAGDADERALPELWERASAPEIRAALSH
ncbi:CYTH and CHAD domain-containing protein [Streptomyces sp. SKN60]|uniref:CYTH and CHAD domain-containing protein n=1 Tax=Streptomyces sp. SKN60 TaxID=2855506 RepID=UPI00224719C4|nr:CYTH and CHAD domain-containing protein [Streptomyces sp. SKN60]MCX2179840.1 CYTH and CHAD domain-containing protein [Streptomyces sp. SKN60]